MVRGTLKKALFGSLGRIAVTGVLALVVVLGGAFAVGLIGVPSVVGVDNAFGDVNESHTEIRTNVTIDNPNPVGAASADVAADYVVSMNDVEMARGGADDVQVAPGESTETFVTYMNNERIPEWWVSHIRNGEQTDVVIDANVHSGALDRSTSVTDERTVETDLIAEFESDETRPINASQPLVEDPVLYVNATRANWGEVDSEHTPIDLRFHAYNPKQYPVATTQIGYTIYMNGIVVGEGESDREYVLQPREVTEVETTTRIENEQLDEWWVSHLENDQVTDLRIEFEAQIELAGAGTTVSVPLDALTYEETVETDIWGNKNDSSGADGTDDSSGEGNADGDSTDGDSTDGGDGSQADGSDSSGNDTDDDSSDGGSDDDGSSDGDTDSSDGGVLDDPLGGDDDNSTDA